MSSYGKIQEYSEEGEDFESYIERVEQYFSANDIEDKKKVPIFLTVIGPKTYAILKNLLSPDKPSAKSFKDLTGVLKNHFSPKRLEIVERTNFNRRFQKPSESVVDFSVALKELSSTCNFGTFLDQALRDRFVAGLRNEEIVQKLLTEDALTFQNALKISINMEQAFQEAKSMQHAERPFQQHLGLSDSSCNAIQGENAGSRPMSCESMKTPITGKSHESSNYQSRPNDRFKQECFRCLGTHHKSKCPFINAKCFACQNIGHISRACLKKTRPTPVVGGTRLRFKSNVNFVEECEDQSAVGPRDFEEFNINTLIYDRVNVGLNGSKPIPKATVEMCVEGKIIPFLIDTGAVRSVIPDLILKKYFPKHNLQETNLRLETYSGEKLHFQGQLNVCVNFKDKAITLPLLVLSDTYDGTQPALLGRDWLDILVPDWPKSIGLGSHLTKAIYTVNRQDFSDWGLSTNTDSMIETLKSMYPSVFKEGYGTISGFKANIVLKPNSTPIFCSSRPVPYALKPLVEKELLELERNGVLERTQFSEWATPLVIVKKGSDEIRLCCDYSVTVNRCVEMQHYPLPNTEDLFASLDGGKFYTVLDVSRAYLHLELEEGSKQVLTINTHLGLWRWNRLPFGVSSAPMIFQSVMDRILQGLPNVKCYIDDCIIKGDSLEECYKTTCLVLERFSQHGIKLNASKCQFFKTNVSYLGYSISADVIMPKPDLLDDIVNAPEPQNIDQLRSFLGLLHFYNKFLPNLSTVIKPLYDLLKENVQWVWSDECKIAFNISKNMLKNSPGLAHYNSELPLVLLCDASPYGVGAILNNVVHGEEKMIACASTTLSKAESNYSQLEREALGIVFGVRRFHKFLYGRHFVIYTDCHPLTSLLAPHAAVPMMASARLQRWAVMLSAYDYELKYRKGKDMCNVDALSRLPVSPKLSSFSLESSAERKVNFFSPVDECPLTSAEIRSESQKDLVLSKVVQLALEGWPNKLSQNLKEMGLQPYFERRHEISVDQNCVIWGCRVVVPTSLRSSVLDLLHEAHPGVVKMKYLARSFVWWPGIDQDVEQKVKSCLACQVSLPATPKVPLQTWPYASRCWERVHVDFAEKDSALLLLVIDSYSKWPEVVQIKSTSAYNTIEKLRTIFAAHGLPETVVSDNGPPFNGEEIKSFFRRNGIRFVQTPPYHPASAGQVERGVRSLKNNLLKQVFDDTFSNSKKPLQQKIDCFLFHYRNTPHAGTMVTPAEVFLGRRPRTRLHLLRPNLKSTMETKNDHLRDYVNTKHRRPERVFKLGERVLVKSVRNEIENWWPGTIVKVISGVTYMVYVKGKSRFVHADHLKPAMVADPVEDMLIKHPIMIPQEQPQTDRPLENQDSPVEKEICQESSSPLKSPRLKSSTSGARVCTPINGETSQQDRPTHTLPSPMLRRSDRRVKPPDRLNL